jgi:DNA repair exonuclease SbcCD nuclease subunit
MIRLIHTSDVHLGNEYSPHIAENSLRAVVDAGIANDIDALLIPGDFFDHNRVSDAIVDFAIAELARFGRPAIVLPGNHDCYDHTSVYRRPAFEQLPPNIRLILDDSNPAFCLDELGIEIWGKPVIDHHPGFRPLLDAPPRTAGRWRVVLAHGHYEIPGRQPPRSSPIWPEDIASLDADYLALGHWDVPADVSHAGVVARYSGAPYSGRGLGEVALVTLDGRGVEVTAIAV